MRVLSFFLSLCIAVPLMAKEPTVNPLVRSHGDRATTPEAALELWFDAVFLYLEEDTRDQGREALTFLTIPFKSDADWERRSSFSTFTSRLRDPSHHHIFRSYARDTRPDNGYAMDPGDWQLAVVGSETDRYDRGHRVLIQSSGADSPRPVYLKRSKTTGLWFVSEFANVYVGIRPVVDPAVEQFE